jgi:carboxymethylenebutenolidase
MSQITQLTTDDGHHLDAYESGSSHNKAALVVLQEIFGVNRHIRATADRYAAEGFLTVAPALFDRIERGVELGYAPEGVEAARGFSARLEQKTVLKDIAAAIAYARSRVASGKVGVVGYCLGGSYAWLSATRLTVDAAVGYYGSKVVQFVDQTPSAPVILHFGDQDRAIPLSDVEKIKQAKPGLPVYVYEAGHGFNCDERASYSEAAAALAFSRSVTFLKETLFT